MSEIRDKVEKAAGDHIVAMLRRMNVESDYPVITDTVADLLSITGLAIVDRKAELPSKIGSIWFSKKDKKDFLKAGWVKEVKQ